MSYNSGTNIDYNNTNSTVMSDIFKEIGHNFWPAKVDLLITVDFDACQELCYKGHVVYDNLNKSKGLLGIVTMQVFKEDLK